MLRIVDGELRIKLEEAERTEPLMPIMLRRYERMIATNAELLCELQKMKELKPREFTFSLN